MNRIYHHITKHETSVSDVLKKHFKCTDDRARELLTLGSIYSNKRRIFEDRKLPPQSYLRLHLQPKRFPIQSVAWDRVIVAEESEFIVANKPSGIPVHATVDNAEENLLAEIRRRTGKEVFVTQRLDIPVSGLLVYAKTKAFQTKFNRWLLERKVQKWYRANIEGNVSPGLLTHYMEPSERSPRRVVAEPRPGWLKCELTILSAVNGEVEIQLHSGRTHQIRVQLAAVGCPILGDTMYGGKRGEGENIQLASVRVEFPKASSGYYRFELPR